MSSSTGGKEFYDKVAKKFGGYAYGTNDPKYSSVYQNGVPEEIFKSRLLELSSDKRVALDVGCGDGKFAFSVADHFNKIVGLDSSAELLKVANQKLKELNITSVSFILGDAEKTPFEDSSFDIIFNRRGPSFYQEYFRLLNTDGYYLEIGIGEKDAVELKKNFERGQDYGNWNKSRLEKDKYELEKIGFKIILIKDFYYSEYYLAQKDLDAFLQGVPIFEDYDTGKDKDLLERYSQEHESDKGIELKRHRLVIVAQK